MSLYQISGMSPLVESDTGKKPLFSDVAFQRSEYNAMRWYQNRGRVPRYQPVHPRFGCRVSVLCRIVRLSLGAAHG